MKNQRQLKAPNTVAKTAAAVLAALCMGFAPQANACGNPTKGPGPNGLRLSPILALKSLGMSAAKDAVDEANRAGKEKDIVGMWEVTMTAGGVLYDHAYQQMYADGNEMQNSGIFPPEVGNVCYGVWTQLSPKTVKLKHYGWLFESGAFTGTFILKVTLTLGKDGDSYTGTFVADVVLPNGQTDPIQHAVGSMSAVRVAAD